MKDCLPGFSAAQSRIIRSTDSRKQVVAAAGSGKTRTVIGLTRWRFEQGLERPGRFLLLSFSRKACGELRQRLPVSLRGAVEVRTFHSFCYHRLLELHPELSRHPIQILEEEERNRFLSDFLRRYPDEIGGIPFALLYRQRELFYRHFPELAMRTYRALHGFKRERGLLEYEDLIEILLSGLRRQEPWTQKLRSAYDMILVDEFQDTDPEQLAFLQHMQMKRLMVVGDDWQAIYGFRGATVQPFLDFRKSFPGAKVFRLGENYRSLSQIVKAGCRLIRRSSRQIHKSVRAVRGRGPDLPTLALSLGDAEEPCLVGMLREFQGWVILTRSNFRRQVWIAAGAAEEQVLTVHRAKGLEFPVVFLDIMGGWSGEMRLGDEEVRVAYVGLTRAENLFCCIRRSRYHDLALERTVWEELFFPVTRPIALERLRELLGKEQAYRGAAMPLTK